MGNGTLEAADRLRDTDQVAALQAYAALQDQVRADDHDRVLWICDQLAPTPPASLLPLLRRVQQQGPLLLRRAALHAEASCHWYAGRGEEAERAWAQGLRVAAETRDRYWVRSCLNLAMVMQQRYCTFEPLVLGGMGRRAAQEIDEPYLVAFAALCLTQLLLKMGLIERAAAELAIAEESLPRVERVSHQRVVEYEWLRVNVQLLKAQGDRRAALAKSDEEMAFLDSREEGSVEAPILAATMLTHLDLQYTELPERRAEVLAQFESFPREHALGPDWLAHWERVRIGRYLQYAVEQGNLSGARTLAQDLLALIREDATESRKVLMAANLGRILAEDLGDPTGSREAFEVASAACLNRIVEADRASREIPELAEATPDDWQALRAYRKRLATQQQELLESVARHLKPGEAAHDVLVTGDMIRMCAWCSRVCTTDGVWKPLAHFVPARPTQGVTHGICETCKARVLAEG